MGEDCIRMGRTALRAGIVFCGICLGTALCASAQSGWVEANKLTGAIGGWRIYAKERAVPPEGYPSVPGKSEVLLPAEVLAADASLDSETQLAGWETRRFSERSAPLEPPTVTYGRTSGELDSSSELGIHLPVGAWIRRSRSLAADEDAWGSAERRALEIQAGRSRLIAYAGAVAAKAELAQAMDRLEVQSVLEELTRRQREIAAIPEFELLSLTIERTEAQDAEALAREDALRAAERLALEMGGSLSGAQELQRRLPLEPAVPDALPALVDDGRLDIRIAEEALAQQRTTVSRARSELWLGGLEVGLLQERFDTGEINDKLELSWRLPLGGNDRRQIELGERAARQRELQLRVVRQDAEREIAEATRAKALAGQRLIQSTEALRSAEAWMDEQIYRYSGMLIGPHDLLRAAARLRSVRSRHIAAQRAAFIAAVDSHYVRAIPTRSPIPMQMAPSASTAEAAH